MFELYFLVLIRISLHVPGFCEGLEASVESFFDVIGEAAGGQLL